MVAASCESSFIASAFRDLSLAARGSRDDGIAALHSPHERRKTWCNEIENKFGIRIVLVLVIESIRATFLVSYKVADRFRSFDTRRVPKI
jgi:hypothetical protein